MRILKLLVPPLVSVGPMLSRFRVKPVSPGNLLAVVRLVPRLLCAIAWKSPRILESGSVTRRTKARLGGPGRIMQDTRVKQARVF